MYMYQWDVELTYEWIHKLFWIKRVHNTDKSVWMDGEKKKPTLFYVLLGRFVDTYFIKTFRMNTPWNRIFFFNEEIVEYKWLL